MKLIVLAAAIGYVYAGGDDTDCGDGLNTAVSCDAGFWCDFSQTATDQNVAETSGKCEAKIADGASCNVDGAIPCIESTTCEATACGGATQCGAALTNADGALGGCCNDSIAPTADANYCLGAVGAAGTVTVKVADAGVCSVIGTANNAGAVASECASGTCTATAVDTDGADVGACDATATEAATTAAATTAAPAADGADGGACKTVVDAAAKIDAVACTDGFTCSAATDDGVASWCQTTGAATEPADDTAAAGALGGACNAEVAAIEAVAACTGTLVCTGAVAADSAATPPVVADAGTCGAATTDDSPAAIFYGMSMVTAAVAYLL